MSFFQSTLASAENNYIFKLINQGGRYLMEARIQKMSLEEKVGQLFQIGFSNSDLNYEVKDMIENYHVGGIIYFGRNLKNPKQTAELSSKLQSLALKSESEIPLFISADQEGGTVTRLKGVTHFPGNMVLGAAADVDLAFKTGKAVGSELKNLGININLAPDLDVNNNPDNPVIGVRSFGEDPELVSKLGISYMEGLHSEGVIATAKHFPGHGDTATDSHLSLPVIDHSRERLDKIELVPFRRAIEAGIDVIMTSHVYFPTIEKETGIPATLSKAVLTGLLRKELDFKGLVITDCMEMDAIVNEFGTVEGAVRTIEAGSDAVLISHSYQKQKKAINAVVEAVKSGRISEQRINESVKRNLILKSKRINLDTVLDADHRKIDFEKNKNTARKVAEAGITLVKNESVLPIENIEDKKITVIDFEMGRLTFAENTDKKQNLFFEHLNQELKDLSHIKLNKKFNLNDKQKQLENSDLVVVCTYNASRNKEQAKLAEKLAEDYEVLVYALRNPYDFRLLNKTQAFITTYDYSPFNQKAAADLILGNIEAKGQLPVSLDW